MIGTVLICDSKVQLNDKIRFDATKSFAIKTAPQIVKVEIRPSSSDAYIDVTGPNPINQKNWFLDWIYTTTGTKTVDLKITDAASNEYLRSANVEVVTAAQERLFSNDEILSKYDSDIMKYLPESRSSWNHIHRQVQSDIMAFLRDLRIRNKDGSELTIDQVNLTNDLREMATFWALTLIYWDLSNKQDDKFYQRHQECAKRLFELKTKGDIAIDITKDGQIDAWERIDMRSINLMRG